MRIKIFCAYDDGNGFNRLETEVNTYLADLPQGSKVEVEWIQSSTAISLAGDPPGTTVPETCLTAIVKVFST